MLLISYALLIIYARVGLTPLYSMLVLFADCWESQLITQAGLENLNRDLHQPSRIRYVQRSFSVRCCISLACWEGIDFCGYSVCCGIPQAIGSFLRNTSPLTNILKKNSFQWNDEAKKCFEALKTHHVINSYISNAIFHTMLYS